MSQDRAQRALGFTHPPLSRIFFAVAFFFVRVWYVKWVLVPFCFVQCKKSTSSLLIELKISKKDGSFVNDVFFSSKSGRMHAKGSTAG